MSTGDSIIGYVAVGLYWGRCVENGAIDLFWGRRGRICRCIFLYVAVYSYLGRCGKEWVNRSPLGTVDYGAVNLYWGRCGREWGDRSLLGTEW